MTARLIAACVSHTHLMFNNIKKRERELIDKRDVYFLLSNTPPPPPFITTNMTLKMNHKN